MIVQILISLLLSIIPSWIGTHETKYQLGILLNELFRSDNIKWFREKLKRKENEVIIKHSFDKTLQRKNTDNQNILFSRFQSYLTTKFKNQMKNYELYNNNGEIKFDLNDMNNESFIDKYKKHVINISVRTDEKNDRDIVIKEIVLRSNTADPDTLKQYVKEHTIMTEDNTVIKILNPLILKEKNSSHVRWDSILVKTNKTLNNTIYDKSIRKSLFEDIQHFINNEEWYRVRGIPYKRGYFLHGPPGTGKTSVAKILASTYNIPIFNLDLSIIESNDILNKLMLDIIDNRYNSSNHYIMLMEDIENSNFFTKNSNITMDCLLNIIDGVVEPYGRILIMTTNNPNMFDQYSSLMRPGRIDKNIEIGNCTKSQLIEMYDLFYTGKKYVPEWDNIKIKNLSPAFVMKQLQDNLDNPEEFCRKIR